VTVRDILEKDLRMDLPLALEVLKAAERMPPGAEQTSLDLKGVRPKAT
jgi:hypothetical protein